MQTLLKLVSRIRESLKYRTFYSYCELLRVLKSRQPPQINWRQLQPDLPTVVAIARESDMPLLAYSIRTLLYHTPRRPPIWLIGDSDIAYAALNHWFPNAPPDVKTWHWEALLAELSRDYQHFIHTWLHSGHYGGYAKKFAITLAANAHADILLVDADVLWFGDFFTPLQHQRQQAPAVYSGQDYARTYDFQVVDVLGDTRLYTEEPLNCGLVYYPQGVLATILTSDLLLRLLSYAAHATCHLEQTLIAYAFWQSGGRWFSADTLATTMSDNFRLRQQVSALARHYAGGKHLFWRDAY
jgi:hypothetical protein